MHTGRVELHDTLGVRQTAITHAVVEWIEFDNVDTGDDCVEYVRAAGDHGECLLHGGHRAAVFESIAVRGRDDERFNGALLENRRKTCNLFSGSGNGQSSDSPVAHEITAFHSFAHVVPSSEFKLNVQSSSFSLLPIPFLTVIQDWITQPNFQGTISTHIVQKLSST